MNNTNELEDFRMQICELKQRLDRESTLNEQLLHDSLRMKMRSVHTLVGKVICIGIVGVVAWIFLGIEWHLSPYFIAFTCLMMLASMTAEYLINNMQDEAFTTNLRETVTRLVRMKKMRLRQTFVGCMVLVFVWMPWLACEFSRNLYAKEFILGAGVGLTIGAGIGLSILFRMQRANDEMIRQIEEFIN